MFLSPLRKSLNASKSPSTMDHEHNTRSIDWKLYNNPHYSFSAQKLLANPSTSSSKKSSELEKALAEIKDLRAELEREKGMRRKAEEACERLMKELVEERRAREGANEMCRSSRKENLPVSGKEVGKECVENPHIKRGISGVEFFRATRAKRSAFVKCREGKGVSAANLECQRAQLRVLMRYKSCVGNGQNLVM